MELKVRIGKEFVISVIIFAIALICFAAGAAGMIKQSKAVSPENIKREECVNGKYVSGTISSYLVKEIHGTYSGLCAEWYVGLDSKAYKVYTIPVADGMYIRVAAYNKSTIEKLKAFSHGQGDGFRFNGKIKESGFSNAKWYENVEEIEKAGLDIIIQDYVILETNPQTDILLLIAGFVLSIIGMSYFASMGGRREVISERRVPVGYSDRCDDEDLENARILMYSMHKDINLLEENTRLEGLYDKLKEMKTNCTYAYISLTAGIFALIYTFIYGSFRWADLDLIVLFIIGFSIYVIAKYHLNSGKDRTDKIMRMFEKKSVAEKIRKEEAYIRILEKAVEMERHEKEKKNERIRWDNGSGEAVIVETSETAAAETAENNIL